MFWDKSAGLFFQWTVPWQTSYENSPTQKRLFLTLYACETDTIVTSVCRDLPSEVATSCDNFDPEQHIGSADVPEERVSIDKRSWFRLFQKRAFFLR